ncbi:bacillithiol biosynthesis deacetylase BshB1 [Paenibacillus sp. J2TS4]|uniref:bacillithiol biosynthesis deacetylase BshB1 n=1 Tax=Paenibacillus sp. J2TS4 TaxID=2807194 RepID=UPI001B144688|nr:bacillithiol biosynthesis deacetylase BshB1 [Paenibacillus sp. J2TS4]GIP32421.1 bacillithiol biosynthesis deacetylase BshB1 [Paenibacillus sp. J2TS4]
MTRPLDLLVFGAHPDDAEIGMGGTIAKQVEAGHRVGICDLTFAEMSSNGTVEIRKKEAEEAAKVLGLSVRANLGLPDRGLQLVKEQLDEITLAIRRYRPRVVFCPYWEDRHPDHVKCSHMVQEAVFSAKLRNYLPETKPHQVEQLYFYFINDAYEADVMVDITAQFSKKKAALMAYRSQFESVDPSRGQVATPLNQGYLDNVEARDRLLGQKRLVPYAEGFVSKLPLIVNLF